MALPLVRKRFSHYNKKERTPGAPDAPGTQEGRQTMDLAFTKMQGCANDYIYLDCRTGGLPREIEALARRLSARHVSVGAARVL